MANAIFFGDTYFSEKLTRNFIGRGLGNLIERHDLVCCNLEGPICPGNVQGIKKIGPNMRQHEGTIEALVFAGFNAFCLANNHIYDFGPKGFEDTLSALKDVHHFGAGMDFLSANSLCQTNINGIRIGFLGFAEAQLGAWIEDTNDQSCGFAWIGHHSVNDIVKEAKAKSDVLVVQAHAGLEIAELPLPEWRYRYWRLIDAGADAVIAHHPHIPQGWETYNGRPIFYSLGNFYFDRPSRHQYWHKGCAVSLELNRSGIKKYQIYPLKRYEGIIEISKNNELESYLYDSCKALASPQYLKKADEQARQFWETLYRPLLYKAVNGVDNKDPIIRLLKKIVKRIFFKEKLVEDLQLLLHNSRIESHAWTIQRALRQQCGELTA